MTDRWAGRRYRSALFVPGDQPHMLSRAQVRGADLLVLDLEDGVHHEMKHTARENLRRLLRDGMPGPSRVYVRLNPVEGGGEEDLEVLTGSMVDGLVIPKVDRPEDLAWARDGLERLNPRCRESGPTLIPLVESVGGLLHLEQLLAVDAPIEAVALGGEDFAADLGVRRSPEGMELLFPRAWISLWARQAGVAAIDGIFTDPGDVGGLVRETRSALQLGFSGKLLIHPAQIHPVHGVFEPSDEDIAWAVSVARAMDVAVASGKGVALVNGKMVDQPILKLAQAILLREEHCRGGARPSESPGEPLRA